MVGRTQIVRAVGKELLGSSILVVLYQVATQSSFSPPAHSVSDPRENN